MDRSAQVWVACNSSNGSNWVFSILFLLNSAICIISLCTEDYYPDVPLILGTLAFLAERLRGRAIGILMLAVCLALHYLHEGY